VRRVLFGDRKTGFGFDGIDDGSLRRSFDGTVIDGVDKIEENILLDDLCVSGRAVFLGEVDADRVVIPGSAEFREFTTCDDFHVSGSALVKGEFVCESLVVQGEARTLDTLHSDVIIVEGYLKASRKVKTINLNVNGTFECSGRIFADEIKAGGRLLAFGEIKCFELSVQSDKESVVGRLQADTLCVKKSSSSENEYVFNCDYADCGTVDIEYAKIDCLRCDQCRIGKGCVIGKLDCPGVAEISPDAVVEQYEGKKTEVL
jgi:cytoskeletal protein CcmA (bactofilin family)